MKIFISYSWDNEDHKNWVRNLADLLIRDGIETILDQYDLRGGEDMHKFMENGVNEATHILVICTPDYVERADDRIKGAGEETSLISSDFYNRHESGKCYLPIIRHTNSIGKSVPLYMGSLVYFDFTDNSTFLSSYQELLRNIYDEPEFKKPTLGSKPSFSAPSFVSGTGTSPSTSMDAIKMRVLTSEPNDWVFDDNLAIYTNKGDVRLQIRQQRKDELDSFREAWTDKFPDPTAYRDMYDIYFDNNRVEEYFLVLVDGCRVSVPLPRSPDELVISKEQYDFGKIIHKGGWDYDEYIGRAGIAVE